MRIRSLCRSVATKLFLLTLVVATATLPQLTASAQTAGESKPIAVVTLNSVDHLLADINFIGSLGGQPRLADQVRPMIGMLQGLDNGKPLGLVLQSDGVGLSGALCIPVQDFEMMLGGLQLFGVTHEDGPDDTIIISAQGQSLFAREKDGWAYLSMMPQMLDSAPENPGELFGKLTEEYDLGIQLLVQNIPEPFKQMALDQLQAGMEAGMEPMPNESEENFEARKEIALMQVDQLKQAIQELDELTLGIAIDSEQQRTYIDLVYTAVAGSDLAEKIAINSETKTDYAGFYQPDAAMMMSFASKIADSDIAQMEQMFGAMSKQFETSFDEGADDLTDEQRAIVKSACNDFFDALKTTLQTGKMDGGAVLNVSPNALSLVAGGYIADPGKVESGLKKLAELGADEEDFPGVNWNSGSHGDVQLHTMNVPIPADEEQPRQLFGDTVDIVVGIGRESAFFAFGRDSLDALKSVMDASAASPQKAIPPMEMTFALAQIMETAAAFVDDDDKPQLAMIANMLTNEANGRDHVRIVAQTIPNGARTRIEIEEGVLRAIGMGAMAAQAEAAGAGF